MNVGEGAYGVEVTKIFFWLKVSRRPEGSLCMFYSKAIRHADFWDSVLGVCVMLFGIFGPNTMVLRLLQWTTVKTGPNSSQTLTWQNKLCTLCRPERLGIDDSVQVVGLVA